jgi:hypothetical protein
MFVILIHKLEKHNEQFFSTASDNRKISSKCSSVFFGQIEFVHHLILLTYFYDFDTSAIYRSLLNY